MPTIGPVFDPINLADEYVEELSHCTSVVLVKDMHNPPVCSVPPSLDRVQTRAEEW